MPPDTVTCPYCNTFVQVPSQAGSGRRVPCPRCGEEFIPLHSGNCHENLPSAPSSRGLTITVPVVRRVASNRRIVAGIVSVMALIAVGTLGFVLLTQKDRRAHDTASPSGGRPGEQQALLPSDEAVAPLAPERWPALAYLPSRANVFAGVRVVELLSDPVFRELTSDPIRLGGAELRLKDLTTAFGLRAGEVDHIVLGVAAENALDGLLVLRARGPFDADAVRRTLKAKQLPGRGDGRIFYQFETSGQLPLRPAVWFADDRTLLVGSPGALESTPRTPSSRPAVLPSPIRDVLRERAHQAGPVWIAGHVEDWSRTSLSGFTGESGAGSPLRGVRTFAAWVRLDGGRLTLEAVARCVDEPTARRLEEASRDGPVGWEGKAARDGAWLTLQRRTDLESLRRLLRG